jgi:hypothetical protein
VLFPVFGSPAKLALQPYVHIQIEKSYFYQHLKRTVNVICEQFPKIVFRFLKISLLGLTVITIDSIGELVTENLASHSR